MGSGKGKGEKKIEKIFSKNLERVEKEKSEIR